MYNPAMRKLQYIVALLFCVGTVFAFYTVYTDFVRFYAEEGTIFKISECTYPNPVTTPCFYGAFAFLLGSFLSYKTLKSPVERLFVWVRRIFFLALAGTLFAWGNYGFSLYKYFVLDSQTGCSGRPSESPFITPCLVGAVLFLCILIVSIRLYTMTSPKPQVVE